MRPSHAEINASTADRILAVDEASTIDNPLEIGHEDELCGGLGIRLSLQEELGMLTPERAEIGEDLLEE